MKYSLSTTAKTVIDPASYDRVFDFSAGLFATAVAVYIRPPGTYNVQLILDSDGTTQGKLYVSAGTTLEAYVDAGTCDLAVVKLPCLKNSAIPG